MKPNHKQMIIAFLWASLLSFVLLIGKHLYLHWPGPGEEGFEEIQAVFEILRGSWFQLLCLLGVLVFTFLTIRTTRQTSQLVESTRQKLDELQARGDRAAQDETAK